MCMLRKAIRVMMLRRNCLLLWVVLVLIIKQKVSEFMFPFSIVSIVLVHAMSYSVSDNRVILQLRLVRNCIHIEKMP